MFLYNINKIFTHKSYFLIATLSVFFLFVLECKSYEGSVASIFAFNFCFLMLSFSLINSWKGYFYFFSSLLLLLGVWLKFTYHAITNIDYVEPTGYFNFTSVEWDASLLVAIVGCLGLIASATMFNLIVGKFDDSRLVKQQKKLFFQKNKTKCLIAFMLLLIIFLVFNLYKGICIIGITPKTILPWYGNAITTLLILAGGIALFMSLLIWVSICNGLSICVAMLFTILVGLLWNIGCLSRGLALACFIPIFTVLLRHRNHELFTVVSKRAHLTFVTLFIFSLLFSFIAVNKIRDSYYYSKPQLIEQSVNNWLISFLHFSIDRWVGLEGIMAVVGYDKKSNTLILDAIKDEPVNKASIYEIICPWPDHITSILNKNSRNFSMPGGIGFLFYSGSLAVVFISVLLIGTVGMLIEHSVNKVLCNPIFTATLCWLMATNFIMFSGVPRFHIPNLIFWALTIASAYLFNTLYSKLK